MPCTNPTQLILAAWSQAIKDRRDGDDVSKPKPGVEWAPLDAEGKVYGPKAVADQVAAMQESGLLPGFSPNASLRMTPRASTASPSPAKADNRLGFGSRTPRASAMGGGTPRASSAGGGRTPRGSTMGGGGTPSSYPVKHM